MSENPLKPKADDDANFNQINPGDQEKTYYMACRATPGCEGREVKLIFEHKKEFALGGYAGATRRYLCTTCNRPFHVTL